ncbi:hypothetical protein B0H12DRAFT_1236563 [Mycena haematopus]|nr:hypothetical protein B0H12DRAFT_1236563 [Mycena haematopus]
MRGNNLGSSAETVQFADTEGNGAALHGDATVAGSLRRADADITADSEPILSHLPLSPRIYLKYTVPVQTFLVVELAEENKVTRISSHIMNTSDDDVAKASASQIINTGSFESDDLVTIVADGRGSLSDQEHNAIFAQHGVRRLELLRLHYRNPSQYVTDPMPMFCELA